jgi:hypothetical protein
MRQTITAAIVLLILSANSLVAQNFAAYRDMFWRQLSETCAPNLHWEKSITEVAEDGSKTTETKNFVLDCYHGHAQAGDTRIALDPAEFGHLFEYAYDNAYVAPYIVLESASNGITANVKPGSEGKSKLRYQSFEVDPVTGKLILAEAKIIKGSALYDLEVHITVRFDVQGRYLSHSVETLTDVLMGGTVHTMIEAKLVP